MPKLSSHIANPSQRMVSKKHIRLMDKEAPVPKTIFPIRKIHTDFDVAAILLLVSTESPRSHV